MEIPKIIGPIWISQGKNSPHPTCGRIPIKIGGLGFQCSVPFCFYLFIFILSGGCTLALHQ
jgi:hypothetical protein